MGPEITLQVKGSDYSRDGSSFPAERLVSFLQGLEGVLGVRYDSGSRRFAVSYDPKRITILRILGKIEFAGQQAGQVYRPIDVKRSGWACSLPTPLPTAELREETARRFDRYLMSLNDEPRVDVTPSAY